MLQAMREGPGKWLAVVLLGLLAVGFVFFGVDFSMTGLQFAARVNGEEVPILEFEQEVQRQQSQYQQLYRIELTDELRRVIRRNVAEQMVRNLALEQKVEDAGYRASDARVLAAIRATPAFQAGGEFFMDLYRSRLSTEGLTPTSYEEQERLRLALGDLQNGIVESTFWTPLEFRRYIELTNQRRDIAYAIFAVESFEEGIEIMEEEIQQHYEQNSADYMTNESVDLDYIELTLEDIEGSIDVTEDEAREYYQEHQAQFETEEVRNARHILIEIGEDGVDAAMTKAEAALERIDAGEDFEALAMELSDDAGTRAQGGDLGAITRGMLTGPFEDALFSMEVGEVRGPVESDFGIHIIRLDSISEGDVQSFESLRDDLIAELRAREAEDRFYELATQMDQRAYEGVDLGELAADLELPLISLQDFPRSGNPDVFENSAPVVQAAFSSDVLLEGLNSGAIELGENHVVVLRVVAHHEPEQLPLDDVREEIENELRSLAAESHAIEAAEQFLSEAREAEDIAALAGSLGGEWHELTSVQRADSTLPTELVTRVFSVSKPDGDAAAWDRVSTATGDQYVFMLMEIAPGRPEDIAREERDQRLEQLAQQSGIVDFAAYAGEVRAEARVRIPDEVLEPVF